MWNAEGKMRNGICGTTVIGPHVRPCDRSYYAVYRTPRMASAVVKCVMQMWKVAGLMPPLAACHCNNSYVLSILCTWQTNSLSHAKHVFGMSFLSSVVDYVWKKFRISSKTMILPSEHVSSRYWRWWRRGLGVGQHAEPRRHIDLRTSSVSCAGGAYISWL